MGMGVSILLIALGAILAFAVDLPTQGLDLSAVGVILMLLGVAGVIADLVIFGDRQWFGPRTTRVVERQPDVVVERQPDVVMGRGSAVVEESYVDDRVNDGWVAGPAVSPEASRRRVVRRREVY